MLNIERILGQDRLLRATTGLNRKAFEELLVKFEAVYLCWSQKREKPRQRKPGGGRKARLTTSNEKLFYILFYFKCYPTFDLAAVLFDFARSQANRWVHRLQPILEKTLGERKVLPLRKLTSIEEFIKHFPTVKEVIVDGTERPICRPKDPEKQTEYFSGKKKRHTSKNLAATSIKKRILVLTPSTTGKTHDKKIQDREDIIGAIPDEIPVLGDLGFLGVQKEYVNIHLPHKKPRGGELTSQQKEDNRKLAQKREEYDDVFIRAIDAGSVAFESNAKFSSMDEAFATLEQGIADYCNQWGIDLDLDLRLGNF